MTSCSICNSKENYYAKGLCHKCYNHKYSKKWYIKNNQKVKNSVLKNYYDNKEKYLQNMKEYAKKNKKKLKQYQHKYHIKNYNEHLKGMKEWYEKNKHIYNKKTAKKKKERIKNNPKLKLRDCLYSRMATAIMHHKSTKQTSSLELLGVTNINIVREHLEKQFKSGMSWENHGIIGWHIDHIIPCKNFDLTKITEQKKCFHYTNLQPLWYKDNLRKDRNNLLYDNDYYILEPFRLLFTY